MAKLLLAAIGILLLTEIQAFLLHVRPGVRLSLLRNRMVNADERPAGSFFHKVGNEHDRVANNGAAAMMPKGELSIIGRSSHFESSTDVHSVIPSFPLTTVSKNNPAMPEYDEQGYTLYTNEVTGEKSRVFEALVNYPCDHTFKIIGANEGTFVEEMVAVVADGCNSDPSQVSYSIKNKGKWTSVTVKARVENSDMLYRIYEKVSLDPRVKFGF